MDMHLDACTVCYACAIFIHYLSVHTIPSYHIYTPRVLYLLWVLLHCIHTPFYALPTVYNNFTTYRTPRSSSAVATVLLPADIPVAGSHHLGISLRTSACRLHWFCCLLLTMPRITPEHTLLYGFMHYYTTCTCLLIHLYAASSSTYYTFLSVSPALPGTTYTHHALLPAACGFLPAACTITCVPLLSF